MSDTNNNHTPQDNPNPPVESNTGNEGGNPAEEQTQNKDNQPDETVDKTKVDQEDSQPAEQEDADVQKFINNIVASYKQHGSVKPILEAMSTDYATMDDLAIKRLELQKKHPSISGERFERLYKKEVLDKFYQGEGFDDEDVELGKELLKNEATQARNKLIEEQKQFLEPKLVDYEAKQKEVKQKYQEYVTATDFAKNLNESKRVAIKVGDKEVNVGVDPKRVLDATVDNDLLFKQFSDGNGGINWNLWGEVIALAFFRDDYHKALAEAYGSAAVDKKIENEVRNPSIKILKNGATPVQSGDDSFRSKLLEAVKAQAAKQLK
jgi:hypothetical protein